MMHTCDRCKKREHAPLHSLPAQWSYVTVVRGSFLINIKLDKGCTQELERFSKNEPVQMAN